MTRSADLPPPPDEYFLEIESHFAHRRGTPFVFSARDWSLIREWKESGIPLSIVIEAIDQCFDKREQAPRRRTISSLSFCKHAVRDLWAERRDLQVGSEGVVPELSPSGGVASLAAELSERAGQIEPGAVRDRVLHAADQIAALTKKSVPEIENALIEIEEELYEDLQHLVSDRNRDRIDEALARALEGVEFRDDQTRDRTRQANLRRILRGQLGLPRLSLFG